jgi:hypothetical protein
LQMLAAYIGKMAPKLTYHYRRLFPGCRRNCGASSQLKKIMTPA